MSNCAEQLLDLARLAGASHAEVYQAFSLSHPVFFEANRLKQLESTESEGLALRLWREGCPGLAVAYGAVDANLLVEKAIALSHLNPPEPLELASSNHLLYPPRGASLDVPTLITMGKTCISRLREAYQEVICSAQLDSEESRVSLLNSEGFYGEYRETSISYYLGVEWVRGKDFLGVYEGEYTQGAVNLEDTLSQILQRLKWAQSNVNPPTGRIPVIFTPNAANLLWSTVEAALSGKEVLEKTSPWSEKLGELVVGENLTLTQDPSLDPHSCPFDDEGTLTQPLTLIENGRLGQFYLDRTTARKLGTTTTGNGFRGSLGRYPAPELVNLVINSGQGTLEDLIKQMSRGLVVEQILGDEADISGEFSVNIDLGYYVENGEVLGRVKNTMLAGNVYQALQQVQQLGGDRRWNSSCYTPSIMIDSLSVVAA
jgi:PmbA protein